MFSFFGRLFGSSKAGEIMVENVSKGIDKLWYTAEEKADDAAQARREGMQVYMTWLESTSGSRVARRLIALIITMPWALAHFLATVFSSVAPFITGVETIHKMIDGRAIEVLVLSSEKWIQAAGSLSANASENNALVGVVLLFYFGGPAAIDGVKGLVGKWVGK